MWSPDVNVLVDAHRADSPHHAVVRPWFERRLATGEPMALFDLVLAGFLRVATHAAIFEVPTPPAAAWAFVDALRSQPATVLVGPGERHWSIFERLCGEGAARGNRIPDAYLAALAIESGSLWVTNDRGFARFRALRWAPPGDPA